MADDSTSLSARNNGAPSPRPRPKPIWQRSASVPRPRSSGGKTPAISRASRSMISQQSLDKDAEGEEEKLEEQERKQSRSKLETELATMTGCYEQANRRLQELEMRSSDLSRKCRTVTAELEQNKERLHDVEKENSRLLRKLTSVSCNLDTTKNKLTNMEWKAMEYEKLSILNDNLKTKNETLRQDNRDLERRLQQAEKELEETQKLLETKEAELEGINERMQDLRLQVREEAIKNVHLDKQLEDLQNIRSTSSEKDEQISRLQKKLEETELFLEHARKAWKEERQKVTDYENEDKKNDSMREEVEIVTAENVTLKKLIIAKDSLLIQKTRTLDNIKNRIAQCRNQSIDVDVLHKILDSKPDIKASFPIGHKLKQEQFGDGDVLVNGWMDDSARPQSSPSPRRTFFDTLLHDADSLSNNTGRFVVSQQHKRPKTAVVKPHNYQSPAFDFRSSTEIFTEALENNDCNKENDKPAKSGSPKVSIGQSKKLTANPKPDGSHKDQSRMRRSKSVEKRIYHDPPEGPFFRPPSPGSWSSTRASSVSLTSVGSTGSASVPAIMLKAAPEKDRQYSRVVHVGDRLYVDLSRSKDKRKHNFQQAVVKFIGNLDKEYDCYRIYMGLKLDGPAGDTDGLYKGKRYFRVAENHGKFVHITRVTSILNRQTNRFQDIEDILRARAEHVSEMPAAESQESFQLKL